MITEKNNDKQGVLNHIHTKYEISPYRVTNQHLLKYVILGTNRLQIQF